MNEQRVINTYLSLAFQQGEDPEKFKQHFEHQHLQRVHAKARLYYDENSSNNQKYTQVLGGAFSEILREMSKFKILSRPEPEDSNFSFQVMHKNISEVTINIYNIDQQAYYLKNKTFFNPYTSFTGIYPSKTRKVSLPNKDPFKIANSTIEIDELKDLKGLIVVELVTDIFSIRNVIKQGNLFYIHRNTAAGNMIMIFDQELNLCKQSAVYYENKKYDSNQKG